MSISISFIRAASSSRSVDSNICSHRESSHKLSHFMIPLSTLSSSSSRGTPCNLTASRTCNGSHGVHLLSFRKLCIIFRSSSGSSNIKLQFVGNRSLNQSSSDKLAPPSNNHCTTSYCSLSAAFIKALSPLESISSIRAPPFCTNHCTTARCPLAAARSRAVSPFEPVSSMRAPPFSSNHCTTSRCPLAAARVKALSPFEPVSSMRAPPV